MLMEDNPTFYYFYELRQHQFLLTEDYLIFCWMKDYLNFFQMEDDIIFSKGRLPQYT